MRIVFCGTPDFAVPALEALCDAGHDIALVVTQPDRKKGRGKIDAASPVKECALSRSLSVFQPEKIREPEALQKIRSMDADVCVVAAFGQIFPEELLSMPKYGCVNIHASLLPRHRGAAPIQQAILDGDKVTGVTLQQMAAGVDTGDILLQLETEIAPDETAGSLFDRLSHMGAELVVKALPMIENGTITKTPQNEEEATHCGKITSDMGYVDWNLPADVLERRMRAFDPWPACCSRLSDGKLMKLWRGVPHEDQEIKGIEAIQPGTIVCVGKESFTIAAGRGFLEITELQLEGKRRMSAHDFLLGYRLHEGDYIWRR